MNWYCGRSVEASTAKLKRDARGAVLADRVVDWVRVLVRNHQQGLAEHAGDRSPCHGR